MSNAKALGAGLAVSLVANGVLLGTLVAGRSGSPESPALVELREEVAALRTEVASRSAVAPRSFEPSATLARAREVTPREPTRIAASDASRAVPREPPPAEGARPAPAESSIAVGPSSPAPQRKPEPDTRPTPRTARELTQRWLEDVQSLRDKDVRARALEEMQAAVDGGDPDRRLAALWAYPWLGDVSYDRAAVRARILPWATADDPTVRRAAREALVRVQPGPEDLAFWLEEARFEDRGNPETTAENLVRLAAGRIEGEVADAVLHLLRDESKTKKAFVMRGCSHSFECMEPRVEARMLEIVRSVPPSNYDSHYFFHFLAGRIVPKSNALVDATMDVIAAGKSSIDAQLKSLRTGLSDSQRERVAADLLTFAQNSTTYARAQILETLEDLAGPAQLAALETMASNPEADSTTRERARKVVEAIRRRAGQPPK